MRINRARTRLPASTIRLNQNGIEVESPPGGVDKKALSFGDFVAAIYGLCGSRRAANVVQLAVNAHVVVFQGGRRFLVS